MSRRAQLAVLGLLLGGCKGKLSPGEPAGSGAASRLARSATHGDMERREIALRTWRAARPGRGLPQEELWAGHLAGSDDPGIAAVGALLATAANGSVSVHCTAMLIAPDVVITAAHCFASQLCGGAANTARGDRFDFVQGLRAKEALPRDSVVAMACASTDPCRDDLALARLAAPVAFDALHDLGIAAPDPGAPLVKIGYGAFHPEGGDPDDWVPAGMRAEATARIVPPPGPHETTFTYRGYNGNDSEVEICGGDSGGPGIQAAGASYHLVGITSGSVGASGAPTAANCNPQGTDTRLAEFTSWVTSTRAALSSLVGNQCR